MYIGGFEEVLFRRLIKAPVVSDDEEKMKPEEAIVVTAERNGFAVWHQHQNSRIIGFGRNKHVMIRHAATVEIGLARTQANSGFCEYEFPASPEPELGAREDVIR